MSRDNQLKERWEQLVTYFPIIFTRRRPRFRCHHLFDWGPGTRKVHREYKKDEN
jgi:hypothetical protein